MLDSITPDRTIVAPEKKKNKTENQWLSTVGAWNIEIMINLPAPIMLNANHHYQLLDRVIFPMVPYMIHAVAALDAILHLQYRPNDHQVVADWKKLSIKQVYNCACNHFTMPFKLICVGLLTPHIHKNSHIFHSLIASIECDVSAFDQNNVKHIRILSASIVYSHFSPDCPFSMRYDRNSLQSRLFCWCGKFSKKWKWTLVVVVFFCFAWSNPIN